MKWVRANLFASWPETVATLLILWLLWKTLPPFIDWAFLDAVWRPDAKACRATEGACWGFIAEIVRAGILAVDRGQVEAAHALGLSRTHATRLVVLPQALRVIVPPMTSQYLNLTKNSSLAVAIGYPDLVSIANTTMNQTGQAIEGIAIIMAVYLTISLSISGFMNWYNARIVFR